MKKLSILLVAVLCVSALCCLVSCEQPEKFSVKANMEKFQTNIVGAEALAIVDAESLNSSKPLAVAGLNGAPHVAYADTTDITTESGLVLGKVDENGNVSEVKMEDQSGQYSLTAGDMNAEIYKMKVIGDFTVVAYISPEIRKNVQTVPFDYCKWTQTEMNYVGETERFLLHVYQDGGLYTGYEYLPDGYVYDEEGSYLPHSFYYEFDLQYDSRYSWQRYALRLIDRTKGVWTDFDEIGYFNCSFMQCYAIDNTTGKMYSLASLPNFDIVGGTLAVRSERGENYETFYRLSVDGDGNLVVEDIMPNKELTVTGVYTNPQGWTFVQNIFVSNGSTGAQAMGVTEILPDKKMMYIGTNVVSSEHCLFDSDGVAYKVINEQQYSTVFEISYVKITHKFVDGQWVDFPADQDIYTLNAMRENAAIIYGNYDNIWTRTSESISRINGRMVNSNGNIRVEGKEGQDAPWYSGGLSYPDDFPYQGGDRGHYFFDEQYKYALHFADGNVYYQVVDYDISTWHFTGYQYEYKGELIPLLENATTKTFHFVKGNELTPVQGWATMSVLGTTNYLLVANEQTGAPEMKIINSQDYASQYLVIEPLN